MELVLSTINTRSVGSVLNYFEEKKAGWEEKGLVDSVYYNYGYSYSVPTKYKGNMELVLSTINTRSVGSVG